jgi:hypothetical protein
MISKRLVCLTLLILGISTTSFNRNRYNQEIKLNKDSVKLFNINKVESLNTDIKHIDSLLKELQNVKSKK